MIANEQQLAAARPEVQQAKCVMQHDPGHVAAEQILMSDRPQHLAAPRQGETTASSLAHCQCCNKGRHVQYLRVGGHLVCGGG